MLFSPFREKMSRSLSDKDSLEGKMFNDSKDYVEVVKFYEDRWYKTYDSDLDKKERKAPEKFAQFVAKHVSDKNSKILDLGAGTGIVGKYLKSMDFTNIDAHDGSEAMLNIAKAENIYENYFVEMLVENESSKIMTHHNYDCVVTLGCFCPKHLNENHLETIIELTKSNGLIIIGIREDDILDELLEKMNELEVQNVWQMIEKAECPDYEYSDEEKTHLCPGVFFAYRVV